MHLTADMKTTRHSIHSFLKRRNHGWSVVALLLTCIFAACANIGSPDGGAYDETPPHIIKTTPDYGAIGSSHKKIVLEFDENIKVDNAAEKVIVSPPQIEQPEISAAGKKITIELMDSIRPDMTYTIDFADAIEDNNEGNPMGDYAFTFSTGETIDTMQVSGYVLDASNLEPIKGIFVGMYAIDDSLNGEFSDTIFQTRPFERISRTDSRGHFVVKGLKKKSYRIYALKDLDQSYSFTQKAEMLAFNDMVIRPTCKPDQRPDTIWHDSLHYDSIIMRGYTHFFPDDIVLLAFNEKLTDRYLLKTERPDLQQFSIYFTNAADTLPEIKGLNFDAETSLIPEPNPTNDTIRYWIRDSLTYNLDTLNLTLTYMGTDTLGQLVSMTDTLELVSRISKAKTDKLKQEAYDEWVKEYKSQLKKERRRNKAEGNSSDNKTNTEETDTIPPMPEEFLNFRSTMASLAPDNNFDITFSEPIDTADFTAIRFFEKIDSLTEPREFIIRKLNMPHNTYRIYAEWEPSKSYVLEVDTGAFVNIYGIRNEGFKKEIKVKSLDSFSALFVNLQGIDTTAVVQLLNSSDKPIKEMKTIGGKAEFYYINPGTYYLRMFVDSNNNNRWDTGSYENHLQAESVYYYPGGFNLRAMWDTSQDWNPTLVPIYRQKPEKITKQKPDKEKTIKNRNAEREKNKRKR